MPTVQAYLHAAYLWLAAINPLLPWGLMVFVPCFIVPWALRTWLPHFWETLPGAVDRLAMDVGFNPDGGVAKLLSKIVQAFPSAVMGAVMAALAVGGDPATAAKGAAWACLAPLGHELMKAMPWIPYVGGAFPAAGKKTKTPVLPVLMFLIALMLAGCSHPNVVCSPETDSAKIQAACDAQQARIIVTGACNDYSDVQHCPALQQLRADCDAKQKAWVNQCH